MGKGPQHRIQDSKYIKPPVLYCDLLLSFIQPLADQLQQNLSEGERGLSGNS